MAKANNCNCQKCRHVPAMPKPGKIENFRREAALMPNVRKNSKQGSDDSADNSCGSFPSTSKSMSNRSCLNSSVFNSYVSDNPSPIISSLVCGGPDSKDFILDYGLCRHCAQRYALNHSPVDSTAQDAWNSQRFPGSGDVLPGNLDPRYSRVDPRYSNANRPPNGKFDRSDPRIVNVWPQQMLPPEKQYYVPVDRHYYYPHPDQSFPQNPRPIVPEAMEGNTSSEMATVTKKRSLSENRSQASDVKRLKMAKSLPLSDMRDMQACDQRQQYDPAVQCASNNGKDNGHKNKEREKKTKAKIKKKKSSGSKFCAIM